MSPATYVIEAARLKMIQRAYKIFKYGINIDLGPIYAYFRRWNSRWFFSSYLSNDCIWVWWFRLDNDKLYLDPKIPNEWNKLTYRFRYQSALFEVVVEQTHFKIKLISDLKFRGFIYINNQKQKLLMNDKHLR
ncbi:hypothetical protein NWQ34_05210 [Mycoplasmopsis felis]|uniref:glycosyl hydrolase family 65 protein n=1 Tax=Mycoplasmopsis felis TaxID=33923 RepID=UPI0021E01E0C|nr:glycosyl hydrolase family 65 protein [Mycoplasmopsis felis]MCU9938968.1 hypothetical protein [Mycoplasmopsis felis]